MSEHVTIEMEDEKTLIRYYENGGGWRDAKFEILQDPITGDWCVAEEVGEGGGEFYVETRNGAIQYALQRCGVIEDGNWTRAPERC